MKTPPTQLAEGVSEFLARPARLERATSRSATGAGPWEFIRKDGELGGCLDRGSVQTGPITLKSHHYLPRLAACGGAGRHRLSRRPATRDRAPVVRRRGAKARAIESPPRWKRLGAQDQVAELRDHRDELRAGRVAREAEVAGLARLTLLLVRKIPSDVQHGVLVGIGRVESLQSDRPGIIL